MTVPSFRTRIKICGLTRAGDVRLAGELGVDAVGFVFAAASPRRLQAQEARALKQALVPLVETVALFKDTPAEEILQVVRALRPGLLQFHGAETDAFCRGFGVPYMKAVAMGGDSPRVDTETLQTQYPAAAAFLFDAHVAGGEGGTGERFDWTKLPVGLDRPFMLAGGLGPDNVAQAIHETAPWGVDVSSGVERAPGLKDGEKMRRFVDAVRRADALRTGGDSASNTAGDGVG